MNRQPFDPMADVLPKGRVNIYKHYGFKESYARYIDGVVVLATEFKRRIKKIPIERLPDFPPYSDASIKLSGIYMHEMAIPSFLKAWDEAHKTGVAKQLRTFDGAYNPRYIASNPANALSLHTLGIAIDFDAKWNGYGIAHKNMQISRAFVAIMERNGFTWLGRMSPSDGMHFQLTRPYDNLHWDLAPHHELPTKSSSNIIEKEDANYLNFYDLSPVEVERWINTLVHSIVVGKTNKVRIPLESKVTLDNSGNLHVRKI